MSLAADLRHDFAHQADQRNPLVTIGLAPEVLNLGLSNDELFDYITKDVARRLVMRFHPDRAAADVHVSGLQQRFADAYAQLQQRSTFDHALAEFQMSRAVERADRRIHDAAKADLRRRLAAREEQIGVLESSLHDARRYIQLEADLRLTVAGLRQKLDDSALDVVKANAWRDRWQSAADGYRAYLDRMIAVDFTQLTDRWVVVARPDGTGTGRRRRGHRSGKGIKGYAARFGASLQSSLRRLELDIGLAPDAIAEIAARCRNLKRRKVMRPIKIDVVTMTRRRLDADQALVLGSMFSRDWPLRLETPVDQMLAGTDPFLMRGQYLVTVHRVPAENGKACLSRSMNRLIVASG